jgi:hypothetical protein
METKSQRVPLPATEKRLQQTVLLILRLPQLLEMRLTLHGIEVRRGVEEDEPVVPETIVEVAKGISPDVPELAFLLKGLEIAVLPLDPNRHQLTTLIEMTNSLQARGLLACAWFVTEGDGLDAFLAQSPGTLPTSLFGVSVYYVAEDQLPEGKLLLVGSSTGHLIDASHGITADIGG